jgi:hypothetical protein
MVSREETSLNAFCPVTHLTKLLSGVVGYVELAWHILGVVRGLDQVMD